MDQELTTKNTLYNGPDTMLIEGPVHNGEIWTKGELIKYMEEENRVVRDMAMYFDRKQEWQDQLDLIKIKQRRKTLMQPVVAKPTGLAALNPVKRAAYDKWLAEAEQREKEREAFEKAEDERIQKLQEEYDRILADEERGEDCLQPLLLIYINHTSRDIIPPDYKDPAMLHHILHSLKSGRANTLQEAIEVLHDDVHEYKLKKLQKEGQEALERADRQQELMMRDFMEMQREQARREEEQLVAIREEARGTKNAVEDAEFWLRMNFYKEII